MKNQGFQRCHKSVSKERGKIMIYGYARVSTAGQAKDGNSLEAQTRALMDAGATYVVKEAYTGTKVKRPKLDELLGKLKEGDTLIVCKLDRIARSTMQGIELVESLLKKGVIVHILNMGIMDQTPSGKLIRTIFFAFAEFQRDLIVSTTAEGKAIARQKEGYREGRPKKFNRAQMAHAAELLETHTYREVTEMTGISKSTLIRYMKDRKME